MTKKDYLLISRAIREIKIEWSNISHTAPVLESLVDRLIEDMESENPRFDRTKFELACGFEVEEE